jgi:hypothetical protein
MYLKNLAKAKKTNSDTRSETGKFSRSFVKVFWG